MRPGCRGAGAGGADGAGGAGRWSAFEEVLADAAVEAVVLATPAREHAGQVERALAAGKHVLVEKPLALSAPEAERVARRGGARPGGWSRSAT